MSGNALLEIRDLSVTFRMSGGRERQVLSGVSFSVEKGECLGLVGESGCGKSVTSLAIMQLLRREQTKITGSAVFRDQDLITLDSQQISDVRGRRLSMIFQEPMRSLNPSYTVGEQISETLIRHLKLSPKEARERVVALLRQVGIPSPELRVDNYPHTLSGGMRQRVMIAMALCCEPDLIIADEPTTALDVTIQAQVLDLLRRMRSESEASFIMITHDLGVVAEVCDRVVVMYAGQIVENAPVNTLFGKPEHPYTVGLLSSLPDLDKPGDMLPTIRGTVGNASSVNDRCRFVPRCPFAVDICLSGMPELVEVVPGHWSRCFRAPLERLVQ